MRDHADLVIENARQIEEFSPPDFAGFKVVQGPMELPGGNWIARCIDPQGAMFSLQGNALTTAFYGA